MKRFLLLILVLASIFSWVGQVAAASKPPAKLCLDMTPSLSSYMIIMTKSIGSVTMADGPTSFYSVTGAVFASPNVPQWNVTLTGTGHMYKDANGEWFHFSVSGFSLTSYGNDTVDIEVYWNVVTNTGTLNYYLPRIDSHTTETPIPIDCKTIKLPSMP